VAHVEFAREVGVDAVHAEAWVELDHQLTGLLGGQGEVVLVEAEGCLRDESELGVQRAHRGNLDRDADLFWLQILAPDLVEVDACPLELDQRVDEVGFDLGFLGEFAFTHVLHLRVAAELLEDEAGFVALGHDLEVDARARLQGERLGEDLEREEGVVHFEAFTLELALVDVLILKLFELLLDLVRVQHTLPGDLDGLAALVGNKELCFFLLARLHVSEPDVAQVDVGRDGVADTGAP